MNNDLLKSIQENVGEIDTKLGYSSQKLAKYFEEKFPLNYPRLKELPQSDLTTEDVLSRVTEILLSYESLKSRAVYELKAKFNSKELKYIFQYFGSEEAREKYMHIGEDAFDYFAMYLSGEYHKFYEYHKEGEDEFCFDSEENAEFNNKLLEIGPFAFYFLQVLIWEDLNHLPSDSKPSWYEWLLLPWNHNKYDDWYEYSTYDQVKASTKTYNNGRYSKAQLRYLMKFYNGDECNKICQTWDLLKRFLDYAYDPTNEDSTIGIIDSKNYLKFVEDIKSKEPYRFTAFLEVVAEIWEESQASNDGNKLFEDFLDDYASAEEY